jgi:octaprenyl-diphosphate synthase
MDRQYSQKLQNIEAVLEKWLPENPGPAWGAEVFPEQVPEPDYRFLGAASLEAAQPPDPRSCRVPGDSQKSPGPEMFRHLTLPGRDLLTRGGKRWRPLLMTLVCETLGGGNAALPLAPLVEFCHNASLIHDDIEDNSSERRGRPSVHLLYGADTAINSGSFLYFLAPACIDRWADELGSAASAKAADKAKSTAYSLWAGYMRRLHLGQAMDISWHRDFSSLPCIEDYLVMCALKTGCLARFAAVLGVCAACAVNREAAGAEASLSDLLGGAAEKIGVGFQILDDVKNLSTGIPGKQLGDDIVEGKKSLPVLLFMHRYPEKREMVYRCFTEARAQGAGADEVKELIQNLEAAGILGEAGEQGMAFIAQGRKALTSPSCGGFPLPEEGRALLEGLIGLIS